MIRQISGSANFGLQGQPCAKPHRIHIKWSDAEVQKLRTAIDDRLNLHETQALFPDRSADSVKDKYYRARAGMEEPPVNCRQKHKRINPSDFSELRFQKDAREGSAKLLQALIDAGLVPELKRAG
jgi:hypothetical protein